jgi:choline-glycine betaine transporter
MAKTRDFRSLLVGHSAGDKTRDRMFLRVLWGHLVAAFALGVLLSGESVPHVATEALLPALFATLAYRRFAG